MNSVTAIGLDEFLHTLERINDVSYCLTVCISTLEYVRTVLRIIKLFIRLHFNKIHNKI